MGCGGKPANDVSKLQSPGKALYGCMLNERGGVIDDLIVYFRGPDRYRLVVNAATAEKDLGWIAVPPAPAPLLDVLADRPRALDYEDARRVAAEGLRVLRGLALAGIVLPDARPERFLLDLEGAWPRLLLADLEAGA